MKKFKFSILAMVAIVIGVALSSFTARPSSVTLTGRWYKLMPDTDPEVNTNYVYDDQDTDPSCNSDVATVCAIFVDETGDTPTIEGFEGVRDETEDFTLTKPDVKYRDDQ